MIQDNDREELINILNPMIDSDFTSNSDERVIQNIIRWKRGNKWWCEHIKWNRKSGFVVEDRHFIGPSWQFCPICGTQRPK